MSQSLLDQESRAAACQTVTFEEEFRMFLKRYRVAFDERYGWD
jgi:hypothetical protein